MATFGLGVVRTPPAEEPVVGLLASLSGPYLVTEEKLTDIDGAELRWEGGVRYLPEQMCTATAIVDPCGGGTLSTPANPGIVDAVPFEVWAGDKCSSFGWEAHSYQDRATRALRAAQSKAIAKEFWLGTQAQASGWPNFFLADDTSVSILNSGSPASVADALAILEQAIADFSTGARGAIHCTRQLGSKWSELGNTFKTVPGQIQTYMGTVIIPDAGYTGQGPEGVAPGATQFAYATLMPTVYLGPITVVPDTWDQAIVQSLNTIEWRAYRPAVVAVPNCVHVGVEVSLPVYSSPGAS
jgi:hypothetical protein